VIVATDREPGEAVARGRRARTCVYLDASTNVTSVETWVHMTSGMDTWTPSG
jgi:hypothetical protein